MRANDVYDTIREHKIITIVRGVSSKKIVNIAQAFYSAGIRLMEVTSNTKGFEAMIKTLSREFADKMIIGAGTVITDELCSKAIHAGAKFVVAPDVNTSIIEQCRSAEIAVLPGAATATEILTAKRAGAKMVKIFPAAAIGCDYIKMLKGPIDDVDFVAVGGVRPDSVKDFIDAGCIAIGIGGSLLNENWIKNNNWTEIENATKKFVQKIK